MSNYEAFPTVGTATVTGYAPTTALKWAQVNYSFSPAPASLAITTYLERLYPQGLVTEASTESLYTAWKGPMAGQMIAMPHTKTLTLYDLVKNGSAGMGYVPDGVTVIGFIVSSADLDTGGSPAIVQAIYLGSTSMVTGITAGQTGTTGIYPCIPTLMTAPTEIYLTTTTQPTTAATGSVTVTALYYS